jgi:pimeloyl-ACP methyl ester carboxylesterase
MSEPFRVVFLPGGVLPADLAYGALLEVLGADVDGVAKDLELYASDEPPLEYSLDHEIAGVLREADARGWDRFHLVGYSGGGAAALAFAARRPERLVSLALLEPGWAGSWDQSPAEQELWREYARVAALPDDEFMAAFFTMGVKPGAVRSAPHDGEPPPWMAKRPAGLRAFMQTFQTYDLDRRTLERFDRPVYFALGALSNPVEYAESAERLGRTFPDFELEVFEERHHFDPPHRIEPDRLARSLKALWERAERG